MNYRFAGILLVPVLLCTGCSAVPGVPGKTPNRMAESFTAEVTVTNAESETRAALTRYGTDAWSVCFTDPAALDGVQLDFLDGEVTASYKGLEFSVPQSAQALRTEFAELMEVVDGYALESELDTDAKDDLCVCEGELEVGGYTLTLAQDGTPVSFALPSYGLVITFDSFDDSANAAATEPTTIPKTYPVTDLPTETTTPAQ